jgi:hypothetical protein
MTEKTLRLHITPFSQDLAQSVLLKQPSIAAESVSYHTLESIPGHSYGYIELPTMEAEKLKKKLDGSILKGKKLRVELARPQKRGFGPEKDKEDSNLVEEQKPRSSKRRRDLGSELHGHLLTSERKVKRGWTEPKKGKPVGLLKRDAPDAVASKYTDKPECIFRARVPPNKNINLSGRTRDEKSRSSKRRVNGTAVHEFEKSVTQPSFIRKETGIGNTGVAAEYIDGKGWVDKDGNLLEEQSKRQVRSRSGLEKLQLAHGLPTSEISTIAPTSFSSQQDCGKATLGDRNQPEDASATTLRDETLVGKAKAITVDVDEETSSSGTSGFSSGSVSGSEGDIELEPEPATADTAHADQVKDTSETDLPSAAVHPLEALFKRPDRAASQTNRKRPLEIKTTFNFFEPDEEQAMPQTPFTARDLQTRGLRSAAPTPDTAVPTRRFFADSVSPSDETGNEDEANLQMPSGGTVLREEFKHKEGESEFAQWFWEHRGENNRAWKKRRREALKDKRQKENRQKGGRTG